MPSLPTIPRAYNGDSMECHCVGPFTRKYYHTGFPADIDNILRLILGRNLDYYTAILGIL
jgi:hypothetical protein